MGKSGPIVTFVLIFLGLGWPWVGEFVGFIIVFTRYHICFPKQHNLVNRKYPIAVITTLLLSYRYLTREPRWELLWRLLSGWQKTIGISVGLSIRADSSASR